MPGTRVRKQALDDGSCGPDDERGQIAQGKQGRLFMMVKVCGITRREDAVAAVEAGATAIGFVFFQRSPRCTTPERAAELGDGLQVLKVGIFTDEPAAVIVSMMRTAHLDVAQIYGKAAPKGVRIWKAFRIAGSFDSSKGDDVEAVLLDGLRNGSSYDWTIAQGAAEKVIVAGGLDQFNVADAIRIAEPWGVDASSKLESAPGIKDHEKVRAYVAAALAAGKEVGSKV
jgi:phosphoribosylanthranilate isomerase